MEIVPCLGREFRIPLSSGATRLEQHKFDQVLEKPGASQQENIHRLALNVSDVLSDAIMNQSALRHTFVPRRYTSACIAFHFRVTVAVALGSVPTTGDQLDGAELAAPWMSRLQGAIPVVAAAVAARQVSTLGDMATAAGAQTGSTTAFRLNFSVLVLCYTVNC